MSEELGTVTPCYTIAFERRSKHSAERLWLALTSPDEVEKWMEGPAKVDLRVGGEWFVDFPDQSDGDLVGVIVRVEPERVLTFAWGLSVVEWTIIAAADGCTYTFVQTGLADRGLDEEGLPAGWHAFLDQLDEHLDGISTSADERKARWEQLKPPYRELLDAAFGKGRSVA